MLKHLISIAGELSKDELLAKARGFFREEDNNGKTKAEVDGRENLLLRFVDSLFPEDPDEALIRDIVDYVLDEREIEDFREYVAENGSPEGHIIFKVAQLLKIDWRSYLTDEDVRDNEELEEVVEPGGSPLLRLKKTMPPVSAAAWGNARIMRVTWADDDQFAVILDFTRREDEVIAEIQEIEKDFDTLRNGRYNAAELMQLLLTRGFNCVPLSEEVYRMME